jgi:hypothetical protein
MAAETELTVPENIHFIECDVCRDILGACLSARTFGEVLRRMSSEQKAA